MGRNIQRAFVQNLAEAQMVAAVLDMDQLHMVAFAQKSIGAGVLDPAAQVEQRQLAHLPHAGAVRMAEHHAAHAAVGRDFAHQRLDAPLMGQGQATGLSNAMGIEP